MCVIEGLIGYKRIPLKTSFRYNSNRRTEKRMFLNESSSSVLHFSTGSPSFQPTLSTWVTDVLNSGKLPATGTLLPPLELCLTTCNKLYSLPKSLITDFLIALILDGDLQKLLSSKITKEKYSMVTTQSTSISIARKENQNMNPTEH